MLHNENVRDNTRCGVVFPLEGGGEGVYLYNAGSSIAKGSLVGVAPEFVSGSFKDMAAIGIITKTYAHRTAVALEVVANATIGLFQLSGPCQMLVLGGSTVAAGSTIKGVASQVYAALDNAGGAVSKNTIGVMQEAYATESAALKNVFLTGELHEV